VTLSAVADAAVRRPPPNPYRRRVVRVLVVEDDALLADGLTRLLKRSGHAVDHVRTGTQADSALRITPYELAILDVGLPDIDGFEVLRRLRSRGSRTNVLVLTARGLVDERVQGLDLGADDYLTKPFSIIEFEARIRALLRRTALSSTSIVVGGLNVDVEAKRVKINGVTVELTVREWTLLELFLAHRMRILSKEQIARHLSSNQHVLSANAIEVYVSRLRSKVEASRIRIRTVRGLGYMWQEETH
jgi:two-component system OmpR family response regulator